jgi:hypothetical protein
MRKQDFKVLFCFNLKPMQACLQRSDFQNVISLKDYISKTLFENRFQNVIYKIYPLILKGLVENPISIFVLCKQRLLLNL